ncbi:MAG: AhpC/TSA family protein [Acidobacteriota bacterium]
MQNVNYPAIVFVYQGTVKEGEEFFNRFWKEARAIADRPKRFYEAFDLRRGNLVQLLGPAVIARGVQAAAKGNFVGKPVGDTTILSGYFLIQKNQIVWQYLSKHSGDHPDFKQLNQ